MTDLDPDRLPRHVAMIMDGNGRWARGRLRDRIFGHETGTESVREMVRCCRKLGIPYLTLYAFSKENWSRPESEVKSLWRLLKHAMKAERAELVKNGIRIRHLGDWDGLPSDVAEEIQRVIEDTSKCDKLVVSFAINYGGRQEIVRAAQLFAADVQGGRCNLEDLTPETFSQYLFTSGMPEPDLLIRTSGELRISNFLLWQLAYTEIYVTDTLWPDFREAAFIEALRDYQGRERRFGKTGDQLKGAAG
ncbi:MAG: isoprenyl transferase [Syntrophobacteraceae bacterium]